MIFTIATSFLLIGLTQKGQTDPATHQLYDWTSLTVGGFIAIALVGIALFIWAESRAKEPIVPLAPVPEPDLRLVDGLVVLRRVRVLRGDHLPAALVPDRRGLQPDELGAGDRCRSWSA